MVDSRELILNRPRGWLCIALLAACHFGCAGGTSGENGTPGTPGGGDGGTAECGNGVVEGSEECDDGNDIETDPCLSTCEQASCGDGFVQAGSEECDDGNDVETDSCLSTCVEASCGDGVLQEGVEGCDDGNDIDTDACRNDCAPATCGDGVVQATTEACDDANDSNTDACLNTCVAASCGDGFIQEGVEECDDADADNEDDCLLTCKLASCGDGFVHDGVEECDDGDEDNTDECLDTCEVATCGDGFVQAGEEECDDANEDNTDECLDTCEEAECGDGFVQAEVEECDDGAEGNGAALLGACSTECTHTSRYELVLSMDGDGTITQGEWEEALDRVTEGAEDCLLRFDNRLAKPLYVEYGLDSLRFDFQTLNANSQSQWDAYAFISLEPDWRAGLGASYRRGNPSYIWQRSTVQHGDAAWNPMHVDLYCERQSPYEHVASFDAQGATSAGSWAELYEMVTERAALCKVRFDNRMVPAPHIEFADNSINFDFHGLNANYSHYDAYAYANVIRNRRAGIGTSYRRGYHHISYVAARDRRQAVEYTWHGMEIDVYCADVYTEEFDISTTGAMLTGTWSDLEAAVVDDARDCRLTFDNRVSNPEYIESSDNYLRFDFTNLHAWHDGWDAYALVEVSNGGFARLGAALRRGNFYNVWQTSMAQYRAIATPTAMNIGVRCSESASRTHVLTMNGSGAEQFSSWSDFYESMTSSDGAYECRLRLTDGSRLTMPLSVEYGSPSDNLLYFDHHPLAAYHNGWESYASAVVHLSNPTGITGSYHRGLNTHVWQRDRNQHSLHTVQATDIDFLCH
jgi:cysteine-rich repeat protein